MKKKVAVSCPLWVNKLLRPKIWWINRQDAAPQNLEEHFGCNIILAKLTWKNQFVTSASQASDNQ